MKKILVVEDEPMTREIAVEFLQEKGYEVFEASCGRDALAIIEEQKPHLVLQDLNLPDMTGLEVIEKTKAQNPDVIFLILTGMEDEEMARKAITLGAFDYLVKPVNLEVLDQRFLSQLFP